LDGGGNCPSIYPNVLWELTDDCTIDATTCVSNPPKMGQTWSKPTVGRIKIINGASFEDRYVAVFGGGYDANFKPGNTVVPANLPCPPTCPAVPATAGRAIYIVDVETGKILYKGTSGVDDASATVNFAPMPAAPALVDFNDDGYLDTAYFGDVNGHLWKLDLTPDNTTSPKHGELIGSTLQGYQPFLLYDAMASTTEPIQPIFLQPTSIFVSGGLTPVLGIAFGTGNRADILDPLSPNHNRLTFVVDNGAGKTLHDTDLRNVSPATGPDPGSGPCPGLVSCSTYGYYLTFFLPNEKATSQVFSASVPTPNGVRLGFLTVVTFSPDTINPCGGQGSSYRYRFFYLNGQGGYNIGTPTGTYADYRETMGSSYVTETMEISATGRSNEIVSGNGLNQQSVQMPVTSRGQNWKEASQ
jgi:Tfp pilus tip-associated adhesin PilY1